VGVQVPKVRSVFVTVPPLLAAIVTEALSRDVELELLANLEQRAALQKRLRALHPDLVVIGLANGESDDMGITLLTQLPNTRFVLINASGDYAYIHEMRPARRVLHDFSPDNLLAAIRED
jgi:DNA-binding NarL/FixJ family response regulator